MRLAGVAMLAVDSSRTRAYLAAMFAHDLEPARVLYLAAFGTSGLVPVPYFQNVIPALETMRARGLPVVPLDATDVNDPTVVAAIGAEQVDVVIYSGPGGGILRRPLLATGKRFLHVHGGALPDYRGSTTNYYSLLERGDCGASAIILNERIDGGPVLASRRFAPPADRTTIDHGYDPYLRSLVLVEVLERYRATGRLDASPQPSHGGRTFHVMHPVLRHVAVLSARETRGGAAT